MASRLYGIAGKTGAAKRNCEYGPKLLDLVIRFLATLQFLFFTMGRPASGATSPVPIAKYRGVSEANPRNRYPR